MYKKIGYLILNLVTVSILSVRAQKSIVDSFINMEIQKLHIPGFEAVAIQNAKIMWTGYYGFQNLEKKIPVTSETLFEAASTSKTVTAAVMMQLFADGKFQMDDDINKYLDFKIVNPGYQDIPITFGQLLRHRSSIDDNVDYLSQFWETNHGDPKILLKDFIRTYFIPNGLHYDKNKNFHNYPPGAKVNYSNMGFALLGYLAERITGESFEKYSKSKLFIPLGMINTGWFLRELDTIKVAMPYSYSDSLQKYQSWGHGASLIIQPVAYIQMYRNLPIS